MAFIPILKHGYLFYDELQTYGDDIPEGKTGKRKAHAIEWRNEVTDNLDEDFSEATALIRSAKNKVGPLELSRTLLAQAAAEREREIAILDKFYGVKFKGLGSEYLGPKFNELIIQNLNQMFTATDNLKRITDQIQTDEIEGSKKSRGYMTIDKYFVESFNEKITKKIRDGGEQLQAEGVMDLESGDILDERQFGKLLYKWGREAVREALEQNIEGVRNDSDEKTYALLEDYLAQLKVSPKLANQMLETLGFNKLLINYQKALTGKKKSKTKSKKKEEEVVPQTAIEILANESRSYKSGLIAEKIGAILTEKLHSLKNIKVISSSVNKGAGAGADIAHLTYDVNFEVDVDKVRQIFEEVTGENKEEIREAAAHVHEKLEKLGITNYALIYESTKSYVLGDYLKAQGFTGTGFAFDSMASLLNQLGLFADEDETDTALSAVMNTAKGAYFADEKGVAEQLRASLARYFQEAMFDDPQTILSQAKTTGNVIHVFRLSEFIVPLSYVLLTAARALNYAYQELTAHSLTIRVTNTYPGEKDFKYRKGSKEATEGTSFQRWTKQQETAHSKTVFTYHFGKEFVDLLRGDLGQWATS